jgi:hypothetical protein
LCYKYVTLTLEQIMHNVKLFIYFFLLLFCLACKKGNLTDCFTTNGKEITEIRYVDTFNSLELYSKIDVYIYQGNEYKVEVIGGKHILKNVKCDVINGTLKIENTNICNFVRGYKRKIKVNVTMPFVSKIVNNGIGLIVLDTSFNQDTTLSVKVESAGDVYINGNYKDVFTSSHGNGDVYLSGSSKSLQIYSNGTNFTYAKDFRVSGYLFISTYSLGDAHLNTSEVNQFDYFIWEKGNIYYTGNPLSITNRGANVAFGKGKLIKTD